MARFSDSPPILHSPLTPQPWRIALWKPLICAVPVACIKNTLLSAADSSIAPSTCGILNNSKVSKVQQFQNGPAQNGPERLMDMNQEAFEPYVSPEDAAVFLKIKRLKLIRMARSGSVPAHPLRMGKRREWRFKLSELDKHMQHGIDIAGPSVRQ